MVRPNRRERRSENRSTVIAVMLVTVAVVSFALGYMAGRGRAADPAAISVNTTPRQPIAQTTQAQPQATTQAPKPVPQPTTAPAGDDKLTFFDTLPKGEQPPLGSGINVPPADTAPAPAPATKPVPTASVPAAKPAPTPAPAPAPAPKPTVAKAASQSDVGPFILQVSSSQNPNDAGILLRKLEKKGYQGSIQQADLGAKGVWYRVFVGPVKTRTEATTLVARLKSDFKVDALVKRP